MAAVEDLRDLGYTVGEAFPSAAGTVYAVEGHDVKTYVTEGDSHAVETLVAHAQERAS